MLEPARKSAIQDWMIAPETAAVMEALGPGKALFVGGCVRNALLGRKVEDVDIATTLAPLIAMEHLKAAGLRVVPTGIDHGTVTAVSGGKGFEVTTLRRDVSTDGRRAVVAFTEDWAEDAQRRDFTMNTLLADTAGNVYDPTGRGLDDLEGGCVVFVGDPARRIAEDYLRILRFFRFHAVYGRGEPDAAALAACRVAADKIPLLSRERITKEFMSILAADDPAAVLGLMFPNGILKDLPHRDYDPDVLRRLCAFQKKRGADDRGGRLAVLAGCDPGHTAAMEKYLLFTTRERRDYAALLSACAGMKEVTEKSVRVLVYREENGIAYQALLLHCALKGECSGDLLDIAAGWTAPVFPLTGEDLVRAGIPQGPEIGRLLSAVEEWWIEGNFAGDRERCLSQLRSLMQKA